MSQTRLLCGKCGFPQCYCTCDRSTAAPTPPAGAEPSPEPRKGFGTPVIESLRAELERVKGERDSFHAEAINLRQSCGNWECAAKASDAVSSKIAADLTAARARIGELESLPDSDSYKTAFRTEKRLREIQGDEITKLQEQLALANVKAEEARRAGVKCFDESHPDNPTKPNS